MQHVKRWATRNYSLLSCHSRRPNAPFAELVRPSQKNIADEVREERPRRVHGGTARSRAAIDGTGGAVIAH